MNSTEINLEKMTNVMIYILPFILLFTGTFGCLGNLITFPSKKLKKNSCVLYFLSTSVFELLTVTFGLISRIADQYGSVLQKQSRVYCKIRYYLAVLFPTIATFLLLMAAIDRCLSTSGSVRCRTFCQLKIAYRVVVITIISCMIACSHTLVFVDRYSTCFAQPGTYSIFYSVFLIGICGVLPNMLLVIVTTWTIRNVQRVRNRVVQVVISSQQQRHRQRTDTQFVRMVISQAILSSILDITRLACYSYSLLTLYTASTSYDKTVNTFMLQFSLILSYFKYSKSFYMNVLTSKMFRREFWKICQRLCR